MKLFFDGRWTKLDHHDGISRFGSNLLGGLIKLTPVTVLIYDKRQLKLLPEDIDYLVVNEPTKPAELLLPRKLNQLGATVVYSPMQIMGAFGRHYKLVFTLHDTIYYHFPKAPTTLAAPVRAFWWAFHQAYWPGRLVLNQADVVVTVSEASKQEILSHHLTDRPIEVVYNAPPNLAPGQATGPVKRELVFMGTLMPYKNAELVIRALALLPNYHLHLAGRGTPDRLAALKALAGPNADRVTFWNGATDAQYAEMLDHATALVSASKYEGFGLPLVEAMARNVPVVCTDMPIFHEVAGQAALYFNPDDPADFAAQITKLEDLQVRHQLIADGKTQAASFSWDKSAARLLEILTDLDAGKPQRR